MNRRIALKVGLRVAREDLTEAKDDARDGDVLAIPLQAGRVTLGNARGCHKR